MFLANASTKRPVAVSCMLIALIALGLNTWRKLSPSSCRAWIFPYITIQTTRLGASPEDMKKTWRNTSRTRYRAWTA